MEDSEAKICSDYLLKAKTEFLVNVRVSSAALYQQNVDKSVETSVFKRPELFMLLLNNSINAAYYHFFPPLSSFRNVSNDGTLFQKGSKLPLLGANIKHKKCRKMQPPLPTLRGDGF